MAGEPEKTSLKGMIQGLIPEAVELLQGTVIQESPIKIQMDNDSKLIIGANITVIPRWLTNHKIEGDVKLADGFLDSETTENGPGPHKHKLKTFTLMHGVISLHNALHKGEKVHVLAIQNGKKYIVLDRV